MSENELTEKIIGAAIEVHPHLGPGLLESAYEECLCYELRQLGLGFKRQAHLPIHYKGITLEAAYRMDLVVEDSVVIEIKATEDTPAIHSAQLLTYLKAAGLRVGLLINFNVPVLKKGLKRIVNRYAGPALEPRNSASSARESREDCDRRSSADSTFESSPRVPPRLRVSASRTPPRLDNPSRAARISASSARESREDYDSRSSADSTFESSPRVPPRLRVSASRRASASREGPR